jgi:hypothetical protein
MTTATAEPMAAKRATKASKPPEPAPEPGPVLRKNVISIRGTEAWRDWLMRLAKHKRLNATDVIDQALVEYAERHGFEEAPPER